MTQLNFANKLGRMPGPQHFLSRKTRRHTMIPPRFASLVTHAMHRWVAPTPSRLAAATLLALGLCTSSAIAEVTLPNVFSDHMVLQRKQANRVWGKASPGEKVGVTIGGQSLEATAGADG